MSSIVGISACVFASLTLIRAPVPPEQSPDPLSRGYLGVIVQPGELVIETVEPNSPAAKAGLKPHDVILRVGSVEPREFSQVVSNICSFRPGAIIEIEVRRGPQRKTFKVKLASRPPSLDPPLQLFPEGPLDGNG